MGWDIVTIKMLQDVMGISYYKARRIFHGYSTGGHIYQGLLEKCPAISFIDATVSSEDNCCLIRRRENQFSFNFEIYHQWNNSGLVWLDDNGGNSPDNEEPGEDSTPVSH